MEGGSKIRHLRKRFFGQNLKSSKVSNVASSSGRTVVLAKPVLTFSEAGVKGEDVPRTAFRYLSKIVCTYRAFIRVLVKKPLGRDEQSC